MAAEADGSRIEHMFVEDTKRRDTAEGLVRRVEERRQSLSSGLDAKVSRAELGQFFTPLAVAEFLAGLFDLPAGGTLRLLDPGAGIGSLSASVLARVIRERPDLALEIVAFEIDPDVVPHLRAVLDDCAQTAKAAGVNLGVDIRPTDFIQWAADVVSGSLFADEALFTACVMNPPYRKMNTGGADYRALQRAGVCVTNLYAAFVALASRLLEPNGQLVAITPRSFANGVYFKPFREFFLDEMAFDRLHVYDRRGDVFSDAKVLQENVVFRATRRPTSGSVVLSSSKGRGDPMSFRQIPFSEIVHDDDPNLFIRIPVDDDATAVAEYVAMLPADLGALGLEVSTGRVVDFRSQRHLRMDPEPGAVPLIYPNHLKHGRVVWPQLKSKKPNALAANAETDALLLPCETYVVVKRFTAKEERRRVVASLVTADDLPNARVAFENHLNVYHAGGRGLPMELAHGLVAFLNSAVIDRFVRQFSGHTQINATDLRQLRYPSVDALVEAGRSLTGSESLDKVDWFDQIFGRSANALDARTAA